VPHLPAAGDELRGRVIVEADEALVDAARAPAPGLPVANA
jgi:hypothetical protein